MTDTTIKVGAVCSLTGLLDTYRCQGAAAYFQRLNDQGGINGRKVQLVLVDDQFDPSKHAALVRRLFEQDGVFAFVSSQAPLSIHGASQYIRDKKVPIVGGDMSDVGDTWGVNPYFIPQSYIEGQSGGAIAATYALQNENCTKIAGLAWNAPQATNWTDAWQRTLKAAGRDFDYYVKTSLAETQFNSYISEMKGKGIDCVTLGMSGSSLVQFSKQAHQQGFTAKRFYPMPPYDPAYISATGPAGVGTFSLLAHIPFETKTKAVQQYFADMKTYQPRTLPNSYSMLAYGAADLFREAVARMGNNLTRANLLATLEAFRNYDNGMLPPITIQPGPKPGGRCGNMVQLQADGTWAIRKLNLCV
ncbi:MAG: ABC transporter substrate-binding protein [Actinomycetota bacterium]